MKSQNKQSVWTCMSEKSFSADVHWMTIITDVYSFIGKCLVLAFMPAGYLLSRK